MTRIRRARPEASPKPHHPSILRGYDPPQGRQPQFEVEEIDQQLSTGKLTVKIDRKNRYYWFFLGKVGLAFARAQIDASHHSTYILSINGQGAEAKQFDTLEALHNYLIKELQS